MTRTSIKRNRSTRKTLTFRNRHDQTKAIHAQTMPQLERNLNQLRVENQTPERVRPEPTRQPMQNFAEISSIRDRYFDVI